MMAGESLDTGFLLILMFYFSQCFDVLLFFLLTYNVPFRSVLGIFSPLLVDLFSHTPCCQMATIVFPDTSSEILSHLLNMLYTGEESTHKCC